MQVRAEARNRDETVPSVERDGRLLSVACLESQEVETVVGGVLGQSGDQFVGHARATVIRQDEETLQFSDARVLQFDAWESAARLDQSEQSTATARAAQISRIRVSRKRPNRLTRIVIETLSTESRFTAERRGTGSSPGSSTTSLRSPRIVVVHGATSARRCRGITASRDRTTTGRRPISAISHHQTSPRAGTSLTTLPRPVGTTPGHPIRLARRAGACHRRRNSRPPRRSGSELAEPRELRL